MPGGKRDGSSFSLVRIKTFTFTAAVRAVLPRTGPSAPSLPIAAERSRSHLRGALPGQGVVPGGALVPMGMAPMWGAPGQKLSCFFFPAPVPMGCVSAAALGRGWGGPEGVGGDREEPGTRWGLALPPPGAVNSLPALAVSPPGLASGRGGCSPGITPVPGKSPGEGSGEPPAGLPRLLLCKYMQMRQPVPMGRGKNN